MVGRPVCPACPAAAVIPRTRIRRPRAAGGSASADAGSEKKTRQTRGERGEEEEQEEEEEAEATPCEDEAQDQYLLKNMSKRGSWIVVYSSCTWWDLVGSTAGIIGKPPNQTMYNPWAAAHGALCFSCVSFGTSRRKQLQCRWVEQEYQKMFIWFG